MPSSLIDSSFDTEFRVFLKYVYYNDNRNNERSAPVNQSICCAAVPSPSRRRPCQPQLLSTYRVPVPVRFLLHVSDIYLSTLILVSLIVESFPLVISAHSAFISPSHVAFTLFFTFLNLFSFISSTTANKHHGRQRHKPQRRAHQRHSPDRKHNSTMQACRHRLQQGCTERQRHAHHRHPHVHVRLRHMGCDCSRRLYQ